MPEPPTQVNPSGLPVAGAGGLSAGLPPGGAEVVLPVPDFHSRSRPWLPPAGREFPFVPGGGVVLLDGPLRHSRLSHPPEEGCPEG